MKVFVSSTSRDLTEHRAAAIRALRRLGHVVVAMEEFTAAAAFPLDQVLTLVREADAYLVIVAWRYGYVPPTELMPAPGRLPATNDRTRLSITEWEYLAAREDTERPVLPFVLAESAPWPPTEVDGFEPGSNADDVRRFRATLMRNHIVSFFSRPEELETLVGAAIANARLSRGVRINQLDVSPPVSVTPDSAYDGGILDAVRNAHRDHVVTIDLATGWWSTRLYLLAFLLDQLTATPRILVLDDGRFVGLLRPSTVVRELGGLHPQLVGLAEHQRDYSGRFLDMDAEARRLIEEFRSCFLTPPPTSPGAPRRKAPPPVEGDPAAPERAAMSLVNLAALMRWFDDSLTTGVLRVSSVDRPRPQDLIRIFDYPDDFVPVLAEQDGAGSRAENGPPPHPHPSPAAQKARPQVINKASLSLQLARTYVNDLAEDGST